MANKTEYTDERELTEAVEAVLNNPADSTFKPIQDEEIKILACFVVRTNKDGDYLPYKWPPAKAVKVNDLYRLYMKEKPHYLLVMDHGYWKEANPDKQKACIHQALCGIGVELNDAGDKKLLTKKPDLALYAANVKVHGAWWPAANDVVDFMSVRDGMRKNSSRLLPRERPEPTETTDTEPVESKEAPMAEGEDEALEAEEKAPKKSAADKPAPLRAPKSRGRLPTPEPD